MVIVYSLNEMGLFPHIRQEGRQTGAVAVHRKGGYLVEKYLMISKDFIKHSLMVLRQAEQGGG